MNLMMNMSVAVKIAGISFLTLKITNLTTAG